MLNLSEKYDAMMTTQENLQWKIIIIINQSFFKKWTKMKREERKRKKEKKKNTQIKKQQLELTTTNINFKNMQKFYQKFSYIIFIIF